MVPLWFAKRVMNFRLRRIAAQKGSVAVIFMHGVWWADHCLKGNALATKLNPEANADKG